MSQPSQSRLHCPCLIFLFVCGMPVSPLSVPFAVNLVTCLRFALSRAGACAVSSRVTGLGIVSRPGARPVLCLPLKFLCPFLPPLFLSVRPLLLCHLSPFRPLRLLFCQLHRLFRSALQPRSLSLLCPRPLTRLFHQRPSIVLSRLLFQFLVCPLMLRRVRSSLSPYSPSPSPSPSLFLSL